MLIKRPVISEKSLADSKAGWFTFVINKNFNKFQIKHLIEDHFKVNVVSVKTATYKSETKVQRSRKGKYELKGFKKAWVSLKSGQKIDLFENIGAPDEENVVVTTAEGEPASPAGGQGGPVTEVKEKKKGLLRQTKVKVERTDGRKKGGK